MSQNNTTINFNLGTILHEIKFDKYANEMKEIFTIETILTGDKFKISKDKILEIADIIKEDEPRGYLINHGWVANEKMKAGAGLAVKINLNNEFYELTFHIGMLGEAFDKAKVEKKSYIKIEETVLNTIFEYLKYKNKILNEKAEKLKEQRTSLVL